MGHLHNLAASGQPCQSKERLRLLLWKPPKPEYSTACRLLTYTAQDFTVGTHPKQPPSMKAAASSFEPRYIIAALKRNSSGRENFPFKESAAKIFTRTFESLRSGALLVAPRPA